MQIQTYVLETFCELFDVDLEGMRAYFESNGLSQELPYTFEELESIAERLEEICQ